MLDAVRAKWGTPHRQKCPGSDTAGRIIFRFFSLYLFFCFAGCSAKPAETAAPIVAYARLYADAAGQTHFSDETIRIVDVPTIEDFQVSSFMQASSVGFFRASAQLDVDWHPAPRRQWIFILSGTLELEAQDGDIRQFPQGSILFVEDTKGKGHKSRAVGGIPVLAAWVPVGPT